MNTTLYIGAHLGLGDAFVLNGMIRALATRHKWVVMPAKWHNRASVAEMLGDVLNVNVLGLDGDVESRKWMESFRKGGSKVLPLGVFTPEPLHRSWDKQFYQQAEVPFEQRWSGFKLPWKARFGGEWPVFVHEDPPTGAKIDRKRLPREFTTVQNTGATFVAHIEWLQNAPEIHVIDSCFLCLADSVETRAKKLVFHRYARPHRMPPTLRKQWEVLE